MTDETPLRADAQLNRERILAAAEEVFLERGTGVSLDDVAKRAGVGIGTLYRRFPTREDLLAATYSARFLALAEASRARAVDLDPSSALRAYLEELVQYTNVYRGFAASLGTVLQIGTPGCLATSEEGARLLHTAQEAGAIRPDISFNDIVCVATAISLATEKDTSPQAHIAHLVGVFMNGIGLR
ncbi:helix-turn-helix domain-containing protein [Neorhizobium sp. Rsf11]|uniref:Helix-turn-helix domain-containing protein n=2 Tax=Neorhizobium TaxID=1525371 RepID=A0ABV0LXQ6_9HYPH|nr:TetR/AcrR family transcriptional regulator [Neorhizobium petrolearium]MCC2611416.1 TetR/AcrR family transcriptional regulator [Neorhizobium petrolearium]WGI66609.1 helix-turn-helix domain containing protein [Neorhizobium petrolearium]